MFVEVNQAGRNIGNILFALSLQPFSDRSLYNVSVEAIRQICIRNTKRGVDTRISTSGKQLVNIRGSYEGYLLCGEGLDDFSLGNLGIDSESYELLDDNCGI